MKETTPGPGASIALADVAAAFLRRLGLSEPDDCPNPADPADRLVADTFAPPCVVVDQQLAVRRCYNLAHAGGPGRRPSIKFGAGDPDSWRRDLQSAVTQACADGMTRELPECPVAFKGKRLTLAISVTPFRDADEPIALVAFAFPAALEPALANTQRALREQTAFLEAVIENIPNMIFIKDADELRFVRMNRAGEELLGIGRDSLLGRNDYDFFPKDEADFFTSKDRAVLESRQPLDIPEEPIHTAHGTRYLHTKKVPLFDPDNGAPAYLLGISEDITTHKQAVEAIETARAAAEEANIAKSRFLANMSHELRTPLTAILGYAELLLEDAPSPGIERDLQRILESSRHLLSVISSVLDLAKIESGHVDVSFETVDIRELVGDVATTMEPLVDEKGLSLDVDIDPAVTRVVTDAIRLRQCLLNLLSNAWKFTESGTIRVRVAPAPDPDRFRIEVSDEGIGMTAPEVARAFEPFYQADSSPRRRYRGTGLGLAITRSFVEMLQGRIDVSSQPRMGTTFTIDLPVRPALPEP